MIVQQLERAQTFWAKLSGWMGRTQQPTGSGLLIERCNSIHTCFMRMPIDVIFLSATGEILHILPNLPPWRSTRFIRGALYTLECPVGVITTARLEVGQTLRILPIDPAD